MDIKNINVGGNEYDVCDAPVRAMVSDGFKEEKDYIPGEICIQNNALYVFDKQKSAGPWDESKVHGTTLAELYSSLNSRFESGVKIKNVVVVTRNITINSDYEAWRQLPYTFPVPLPDAYAGLTGVHPASGKTACFFVNPSGNLVCDTAITNESYGSWSVSGAYVGKS